MNFASVKPYHERVNREGVEAGRLFNAKWKETGGYSGALARNEHLADVPIAATGHMPFPGHRHMGEIG